MIILVYVYECIIKVVGVWWFISWVEVIWDWINVIEVIEDEFICFVGIKFIRSVDVVYFLFFEKENK